MKQISFLIKPASSLCNMKCEYCFYKDVSKHRSVTSYGIMHEDEMKNLIDFSFSEIEQNGSITYAFQGGEPTLAGLAFFKAFTAYVEEKRTRQTIHYAIQTNALLLDEEWVSFLKEKDFLVGVSLDGYLQNHDDYRKDEANKGTFQRVMKSIERLKKRGVSFNILCVLSNSLAAHPQKLYQFFKKQGFDYIQFIPCMDHRKSHHKAMLTPPLFYNFYKTYFDLWFTDYKKGCAQHINLFDNIMLIVNDRPPYQCGMLGYCSMQFVIEADGSIYPCDFYVEDQLCLGNVMTDHVSHVLKHKILSSFLQEKTIHPLCKKCSYENLCHGGCKRMNAAFLGENYCGYQKLLEHIITQ